MKKIFTVFVLLFAIGFSRTTAQSVTDSDGNVYDTVSIGTQVWMKQNLKTTKYRNGATIPNIADSAAWCSLTTGARCYYDNDSATYAPVFGALYNYYAAYSTYPKILCPLGWHVSTDAEWTTLINYLGGEAIAGGKLKSTGMDFWSSPNTGATNSSGFTGLPSGFRNSGAAFYWIGSDGLWWNTGGTSIVSLVYSSAGVGYSSGFTGGRHAVAVRCVRDFLTDVKEINKTEQIKIYPNPATDNLSIETNSNATIEVMNMQGQIIKNTNTSSTQTSIDISNLSNGVYTVKVKTDKKTIIKKLIKQ